MIGPDGLTPLFRSSSTSTTIKPNISVSDKFTEEFELSSPLTQITSSREVFHEHAFLHHGPVFGVGNGTYLVNGTEIFLIDDSTPPSLQQITGNKDKIRTYHTIIFILFWGYPMMKAHTKYEHLHT